MTTVDALPMEILHLIFGYLPFSTDLAIVSKKFNLASRSIDDLTITSNPQVHSIGLQIILQKFKALRSLTILGNHLHPQLHHEIAKQFTGSPTLESINSISDFVIFGAFKCPKLKILSLPLMQAGTLDFNTSFQTEPDTQRRNVVEILRRLPNLERLTLDALSFESVAKIIKSDLKYLKITSLNEETMEQLLSLVDSGLKLDKLESLALDLDHSPFAEDGLKKIVKCCPNLSKLQVKYAYLSENFIQDVCTLLPNIKTLNIAHCDVWFPTLNWGSLVTHLASYCPSLSRVAFKNCMLLECHDANFDIQPLPFPHTNLKHLKLFDMNDNRPDEDDFMRFVAEFPHLESLRIDLSSRSIPLAIEQFQTNLQRLEVLEIRFAKFHGDPEKRKDSTQPFLTLANLKELYLWGIYDFPDFIIKPNESRLQVLELNYMISSPKQDFEYKFDKLQSLSIKAMTHLAESICLKTLGVLTANAPGLEKLEVVAITHRGAEFSQSSLNQLMQNCPKLKSFATLNFKIRKSSMQLLLPKWPELVSLSIRGNSSVDSIDANFETTFLEPFMSNHKQIKLISLGVAGLEWNHTQTVAQIEFASTSFAQNYPYLVGMSGFELFRVYERYLREKYRGVQFTIRGPVEDSFHVRGKRLGE